MTGTTPSPDDEESGAQDHHMNHTQNGLFSQDDLVWLIRAWMAAVALGITVAALKIGGVI